MGKEKKDLPPCKVVVRRLPPTMAVEQFLDQVSPVPEHNYFRYVKADWSLDQEAFCRAYINFKDHQDVYMFQEKFDGYVFVDSKGNEFEAVVEFAPNQKISGVKEGRRKDVKMGTIEQDADYLKFLEALESEGPGSGLTVAQNLEEIEEKERLKKSGVTDTTPLLQFFKENKEEKLNKRKKEEERRKTRDEERQLRREKKEKEIRENEKRKSEKRNTNIEDDIKSRQRDRKDS